MTRDGLRIRGYRSAKWPMVLLCAVVFFGSASACLAEKLYVVRRNDGSMTFTNRPAKTAGATSVEEFRPPKARFSYISYNPMRFYRRGKLFHQQYHEIIIAASNRYGVNASLVKAVIHAESAFNPRARSRKGALGLMQLMPETAREVGVARPFEPAENIRGGVTYLRQLLERYKGNLSLSLAAYNAGAGAVDSYGGIPPYRETQQYVRRVLSLYRSYQAGTGQT